MDEARAACALDISGRPFTAFEGAFPAERVGDFDTDLVEEFFRAVANTAKLTLHVRVRPAPTRITWSTPASRRSRAPWARRSRPTSGYAECPPRRGSCDAESGPRASGRAGRLQPRLAILDYGMGNLPSVAKALEHVGAEPGLTNDPRPVREADGIVLPGVGAMPRAMEQIRRLSLDELLHERLEEAGVPLIGVCMGMQLLFESTAELGGAEGIGLLEGAVERLYAPALKVPQIGWNPVSWRRETPLTAGLPDPCAFYHANSFAPRPTRAEDVLGTADYGGEFVSAVGRPPVYGVQFHPEKSGPHGLRLLGNFVRACVTVAA